MNAGDYSMLPWTIRGPARVTDENGSTHYEMRVRELPDLLVLGGHPKPAIHRQLKTGHSR
jgi:hypothetical protein